MPAPKPRQPARGALNSSRRPKRPAPAGGCAQRSWWSLSAGLVAIVRSAPRWGCHRGRRRSLPMRWCGGCGKRLSHPGYPVADWRRPAVAADRSGAVGALAGAGGMVVVCMIWRLFMRDSDAPAVRRLLVLTSRPRSSWPCGSIVLLFRLCWSAEWLGMGVLHDDRGHRFRCRQYAVKVLFGNPMVPTIQPEESWGLAVRWCAGSPHHHRDFPGRQNAVDWCCSAFRAHHRAGRPGVVAGQT